MKIQKDRWEEEFDAEKQNYAKLRPLQGVVIPKFLGEVTHEESCERAILLSDVGRAAMCTPPRALLEVDEFRRLLRQALTACAEFGLFPDDERLDNFHLSDGKNHDCQPRTDGFPVDG